MNQLKNGFVEFKTAFCLHCGDSFEYPKHFKPKPRHCSAHDPSPLRPVNLDAYAQAVLPDEPAQEIQVPDVAPWTPTNIFEQLEYPRGNQFLDSPRLKSAEQIRQEYRSRLEQAQLPVITPIDLPVPKAGPSVGVTHLGDIHIGTDACTYDAFKEILEWVLYSPDEYLALQGDMVDLLTGHSVGIMAEQSMTIQEQFTLATDDLLPLARARKILWMLRGNHEDRLDKATKNIVDGAQTMARHLDVRYLQTEGYTQVRCAGAEYLSYNIHGFSAGRRAGSRRNKMEDMLKLFPSADVITCGHNHHLDTIQLVTEEIDSQTMRPRIRQRWGIFTGTYHSYIGYPADAGLGAGPLGCVRLEFNLELGKLIPQVLPVIREGNGYRHVLPAR